MDNTQEITLDIKDNQTYQQLYTKQYDYGSSIIFHIVNDGSSFDIEGVTAIFSLKKPDGRFIENNADVINGDIKIKITEQMTSVYGKAKFSITLLKDEVAITTITGIMKIDEAVIHPEDIESSDEYNVITDILHKVSDDYEAIKVSESNAKESEEIAKASEINAQISEANTLNYATKAKSYAIGETNIRPGENTDNAKYYCQQSNVAASEALTKASEASTYATNAKSFATTAATKATQADNSATSASTSATTAVTKALEAADSSQEAKSYAVGTNNIFRENDETDNSKYYYEQLKGISEGLNGALLPMGTIAFSDLKTQNKQAGFMYNISDSFVTDETFREGAGYTYPEGTNVYYTADGYWDCLAGIPVTGVKGKNETSYRKGNINITPEDVGALSANDDTKDNTVAFLSEDSESESSWSDVAVMSSGEKHSSLFNKISTMFKNIRYLNKILGTTDISSIGGGTVTGAINAVNNNLANKQPMITGAATTVTSSNLTPNMALRSSGTGKIQASVVTAGELNQLQGVKSNIQTQLNKLSDFDNNVSNQFNVLSNKINNKISITDNQNITGHKYFHADVLLDANAYANSAIQMIKSNNGNNNQAAGIAFHNMGVTGAYLFLHPTSQGLWVVYSDGKAYAINQTYSGTWSSKQAKENIIPMSEKDAKKILDIEIVDFDYKNGDKNQHGAIAEDLYRILPDCVNMPENYNEEVEEAEKSIMNTPSIDYLKLIPYLIKMLQVQQKQIDDILKLINFSD